MCVFTTDHLSKPAYLESLGCYGDGGLHHAVCEAELVSVVQERRYQGNVLGTGPGLEERQRPFLRLSTHVVQNQIEPDGGQEGGDRDKKEIHSSISKHFYGHGDKRQLRRFRSTGSDVKWDWSKNNEVAVGLSS